MSKKNNNFNYLLRSLAALLIVCLVSQPAFAQYGLSASSRTDILRKSGVRNQVRDLRDDLEENIQQRLKPGMDQISRPEAIRQRISVHVLGDVANPGIYKTQVSSRAADILALATPKRKTIRVIQIRHPGEKTRYFDLYQYYYFGNLAQNPYLKDNDVIFVPKAKGAVRIEGPVARPGTYELWYEKNLYQIVQLAGGFTSAMSKMHPIKVIRFSDGGEKFILDVVQTKSSLKNFKIQKGDIYVVPDVINVAKKFDYSVESIPGENLVYPTSVPDVFVIGAVTQPGAYPYKSHFTVKDYIGYAGPSEIAKLRSVVVMREGKKKHRKLSDKVYAGDVIIVKEKNVDSFMKYVGIASTILSVTLTALLLEERL